MRDSARLVRFKQPWLAKALITLLLLLSAYQIVKLYEVARYHTALPSVVKSMPSIDHEPLNQVKENFLFGEVVNADIPLSHLDLQLHGVLTGTKPQAVIASGSGSDKVYHQGDNLPGGANLQQVLARAVIIKYNGRSERLVLPQTPLQFSPAPKPWKN